MALPTHQASGAIVEAGAGTGAISPAWPTHLTNDIALLIVVSQEPVTLSVPAGFREIASSPRFDRIGTTNYTRLTIFWCRATSAAMGAPSVWGFGAYKRAIILTFRGVPATGRPWNITAGNDTAGTGSASVSIPGGTTTTADNLIVGFLSNVSGTGTPQASGWTNASLGAVTEILDNGSGLATVCGFSGTKAVAGVVSATTATLANSTPQGRIMIALPGVAQPEPPSGPYLHGYGIPVSSATVDVSPAWPPHEANDIGLLIVESGGWPVTLAVAAGFVEVASSPQNAGVSGTASSASIKVYWKRATGAAEGAPTVDFIANHIHAQIITIRGAAPTGDPWDVSAGDFTVSASANVTWPGVSTTKDNDLVVNILGNSVDSSVSRYQTVTNASLDNLVKKQDLPDTVGDGSGIVIVTGRKLVAGVVSTTTAVGNSSSHQGRITLAFKLPSSITPHDKLTYNLSMGAAGLLIGRKIIAEELEFNLTLKDVNFSIGAGFVLSADRITYHSAMNPAIFRKRLGRWERRDAEPPRAWANRLPLEED